MYKLSRKAAQDLDLLYHYSAAQFGDGQAEQYLLELEHAFLRLVDFPLLGKEVEHLRPNLRCYVHRSHTIYYKPSQGGILIVRVLDQRMNHHRLFQ